MNRGEGDDIKTIEKCLLETKDTLKSEIEQFNGEFIFENIESFKHFDLFKMIYNLLNNVFLFCIQTSKWLTKIFWAK